MCEGVSERDGRRFLSSERERERRESQERSRECCEREREGEGDGSRMLQPFKLKRSGG